MNIQPASVHAHPFPSSRPAAMRPTPLDTVAPDSSRPDVSAQRSRPNEGHRALMARPDPRAAMRRLESLGGEVRSSVVSHAPAALATAQPLSSKPAVAAVEGTRHDEGSTAASNQLTIDGLLGAWGTDDPLYDLTGNGTVGVPDLLALLKQLATQG